MVFELVEIDVTPGHEGDFEKAVAEALPHFRAAPGCRSLALQRSIESPSHYHLVVGWGTVDDHMQGFRNSPAFAAWRGLVGPHFAAAPSVSHVQTVLAGF